VIIIKSAFQFELKKSRTERRGERERGGQHVEDWVEREG